MDREFKGIWIDRSIWLHPDLTLIEKALLAEIDSFTGDGKSFYKTNETIQEEYKISRPTISRALKKLEGLGFIKIEFDGRKRKVTYQADRKIFTGSPKKMIGQGEKNDRADRSNDTSINTMKEQSKEHIKKGEIHLPWDSKEFEDIWNEWKADRKERRIKNYTHRGELAALHKLYNETNGDEQHAIESIQLAIANQWQGIFPREKKGAPKSSNPDELTNYLKYGII